MDYSSNIDLDLNSITTLLKNLNLKVKETNENSLIIKQMLIDISVTCNHIGLKLDEKHLETSNNTRTTSAKTRKDNNTNSKNITTKKNDKCSQENEGTPFINNIMSFFKTNYVKNKYFFTPDIISEKDIEKVISENETTLATKVGDARKTAEASKIYKSLNETQKKGIRTLINIARIAYNKTQVTEAAKDDESDENESDEKKGVLSVDKDEKEESNISNGNKLEKKINNKPTPKQPVKSKTNIRVKSKTTNKQTSKRGKKSKSREDASEADDSESEIEKNSTTKAGSNVEELSDDSDDSDDGDSIKVDEESSTDVDDE